MKTDSEKGIGRLQYIVCFFLTFAYRFAYILGPAQMRVTYDDIGIICGPATLAGCNWLGAMKYVRYYGQSFSVLLTPFFVLFKGNPTAIWYSIEIFYLLTASFGAVLLYYIGRKYFKVNNDWVYVFCAALATIAFVPNNDMSNEPALFISSILIMYLLILISNCNKVGKTVLFQILTILAMMFGYLANSRGLAFWAVIPVLWLWIFWKYKGKQLGYWYIWIPGLLGSLWGAYKIRDWVILRLWDIDIAAGEEIINADVPMSLSKIIDMLTCKSGIKAFLMTIFGGVYVSSIQTYGLFLFLIVLVAYFLFKKKRNQEEIGYEISGLVGIGCFLVGLFGVALSSMWGVAMWEDIQNEQVTIAYDSLYYYRYYASFLAPGLFAAGCYFSSYLKEIKVRRIVSVAVVLIFTVTAIFNFIYITEFATMYDECCEFGTISYVHKSVQSVSWQFVICLLIMVAFLIIFIMSLWHYSNKFIYVLMSLLIILPIAFASNPTPYKALFNDHCDTGFNLVRYMERIPEAEDLGDTLYLAGESKTVINYQYALMEYKISEDIPQKEDIIVFANNNDSLLDDSYEWIQLDSNESVYVKGKYSEIVKQFLQHRN